MKLPAIVSLVVMTTTGLISATTIPLFNKTDPWGFVNLDLDGVLRSWSFNGTVLDAAPLDPDQISTFINMREGIVETQRTIDEKKIFAQINGLDVPISELFNPAENVRPVREIANAEASRLALGGVLPSPVTNGSDDKPKCVTAYCSGQNYKCEIYTGCKICYASICWGGMGIGSVPDE